MLEWTNVKFNCFVTNYAITLRKQYLSCHGNVHEIMSNDTDLFISVPRSCLNDFYSKYLNLVETFYYVTLSERKSVVAKEKPEYVFFNVIFNLSPVDGNFNPQELVGRIQVSVILLVTK